MGQIGIYKITNKINTKCYVGSSNNVKKRLYEHKRVLLKNKHHSILLQRAVNKYGIENFIFELVIECEEENLIELEQKHFDELKPEYNIAKTAGSQRGYHHTKETKERLREVRKNQVMKPCSDETKRKIGEANKNRTFSEEHRERLSDAHKGKKLTEEHIEKIRKSISNERMRENQKLSIKARKPKKIFGVNETDEIIIIYATHKEACLDLKLHPSSLWRIIKKKTFYNNLIWKLEKNSSASSL